MRRITNPPSAPRALLIVPLLLLTASVAVPGAFAVEIDGPDEVAVGTRPVRLTIEGVTVQELIAGQGRLEFFPRRGIEVWDGATWQGLPYILAFFDEPGEYILQVMLVRDGTLVYAEKVVTAKGEPHPDPKPDPDPPPPAERVRVVIVEDANRRSQVPYEQVQTMSLPDIRQLADGFLVVDSGVVDQHGNRPASLVPALDAAAGQTLPWMVLLDADSGAVAWQGDVPAPAEARELLRKYRPQEPQAAATVASARRQVQVPRYVQQTVCGPTGCRTVWRLVP